MYVNTFGSGNNDFYDTVQDLYLNNNTIHNKKDPKNEHDVANKRCVDSKSSFGDSWTIAGNALQSDGEMGTLNDNSSALVRNNKPIPQIKFLSSHIVAYKNLYLEKVNEDGFIGIQS